MEPGRILPTLQEVIDQSKTNDSIRQYAFGLVVQAFHGIYVRWYGGDNAINYLAERGLVGKRGERVEFVASFIRERISFGKGKSLSLRE